MTIRPSSRWSSAPRTETGRRGTRSLSVTPPWCMQSAPGIGWRSHDIEDVGQTVWLLLVEHLGQLREPAALPGWLATTTAHECLRVVKAASKSEWRTTGEDDSLRFVDNRAIDEEILMAERNAGLRAVFAELPARCQQLLAMLISDPPHSYAMIHEALGIPVGSIGPQRARCLDRLRRSSAFIALGEGEIAGQRSGR